MILTKTQFQDLFKELYEEIAHGDDEHRKWLKDKIDEFITKKLNIDGYFKNE